MKIRISQYAFEVAAPYRAGHVLSAEEAQALNKLRAENIRNIVSSWVKEATKGLAPGELIPPADLSALTNKIYARAGAYKFEPLEQRTAERRTPLEIELRELAEEKVREVCSKLQIDLSTEGFEEEVRKHEVLADVQEEARKRLAAKAAIAAQGLEDLIS